jgi:uncharacterized protein CbrC (UPF0167 family)
MLKVKRVDCQSYLKQNFSVMQNYVVFLDLVKRIMLFWGSADAEEVMKKFTYALKTNQQKFNNIYQSSIKKAVMETTPEYDKFLEEYKVLAKPLCDEQGTPKQENMQEIQKLYTETLDKHTIAKQQYEKHNEDYIKYMQEEVDIDIHLFSGKILPPMSEYELNACAFFIDKDKPDIKVISGIN